MPTEPLTHSEAGGGHVQRALAQRVGLVDRAAEGHEVLQQLQLAALRRVVHDRVAAVTCICTRVGNSVKIKIS